MTGDARSERTVRLLVAQLEALSRAATALGPHHDEVLHLLESASVATTHAVALELLGEDQAASIWADAHRRHPELPQAPDLVPAA